MEWKFKKDVEPVSMDADVYTKIKEGYFNPSEVLDSDYQVRKLKEAYDLLESFQCAMEEAGLIEEC